jgi:hypothetical protein
MPHAIISFLKVFTNEKGGGLKVVSLTTASQPDVIPCLQTVILFK